MACCQRVFDHAQEQAQGAAARLQALGTYAYLFQVDPVVEFARFLSDRDAVLLSPGLNRLAVAVCGEPLQAPTSARRFGTNLFGRKHDLAALCQFDDTKRRSSEGSASLNTTVPTLEEIASCLRVFSATADKLAEMPPHLCQRWLALDLTPVRATLRARAASWRYAFGSYVLEKASAAIGRLSQHLDETDEGICELVDNAEEVSFMRLLSFFHEVGARQDEMEAKLGPLHRTLEMLQTHGLHIGKDEQATYLQLRSRLKQLLTRLEDVKQGLAPRVATEGEQIKQQLQAFDQRLRAAHANMRASPAFGYATERREAQALLTSLLERIDKLQVEARDLNQLQQLTHLSVVDFTLLAQAKEDLAHLDEVLATRLYVETELDSYLTQPWERVSMQQLEAVGQAQLALVEGMQPSVQSWDVCVGLRSYLTQLLHVLPALAQLKVASMRSRHWKKLFRPPPSTGVQARQPSARSTASGMHDIYGDSEVLDDGAVRSWTLDRMLDHLPAERLPLVQQVVEMAAADVSSENGLKALEDKWTTCVFRLSQWRPGLRYAHIEPPSPVAQASILLAQPGVLQGGGRKTKVSVAATSAGEEPTADALPSGMRQQTGFGQPVAIISDLDEIFGLVEHHQALMVAMLADDAGSRVLQSEIAAVQARVKLIQTVLVEWQAVQAQWLQLTEAFVADQGVRSEESSQHASVAQLMARRKTQGPGSKLSRQSSGVRASTPAAETRSAVAQELPKEAQILSKVPCVVSLA